MKFDNFNTGRCKQCGTIKQYQPGVNYEPKDFECKCNTADEKKPEAPTMSFSDRLKAKAKSLGVTFPHNISDEKLSQKIKEAEDGE